VVYCAAVDTVNAVRTPGISVVSTPVAVLLLCRAPPMPYTHSAKPYGLRATWITNCLFMRSGTAPEVL
jgi:hypothetical protein